MTLNTAGTGYVVGDQLTIDGASLTGGTSPADDIVVTLTSVDGILSVDSGQFTISQTVGGVALDSLMSSASEHQLQQVILQQQPIGLMKKLQHSKSITMKIHNS